MNDRKSLDERAQMSDLDRLRHSCAHVMATAILKIWPEAQFAYGPPGEFGFYYDFDMEHRITPDDFAAIEAEMKKIAKENQKFEKCVISRDEARALAQSGRLGGLTERQGNPSRFKLDLIDKIPEGEEISCYQNGDFLDLCAGPHVNYTSKCKNVRLTSVSASFYMGDESKGQLQRLYGTAFPTAEELEQHFIALEEAKKRDHRKLGRELQLFHIDDDVGQGLILWTPRGAIIRQELQNFISGELRKQGYEQVFTPHIGKLTLYKTSGHFPYYKESQFGAIVENDEMKRCADSACSCAELVHRLEAVNKRLADGINERAGREVIPPDRILPDDQILDGFMLRPMNCPHHIKIYDSQPRSYRDLPVRLAEFGTVYRWEQSGELNGMTRVRGFTQDDAHLFCTEDQVAGELLGCLSLVNTVLTTLGMSDFRVRVGLRDADSNKYTGDPHNWDKAEAACRAAAATLGVPFTEEPGEAAFYGPKIDFVVKDVIGREWQLGTVQVDYNLPIRFDLTYIGADNRPHRPVMIHRAPFGSMERFTGVLIEHFAGHFPVWLAPEQARVLTISEKSEAFATEALTQLKSAGLRATLDNTAEKIGAKIRNAQLQKIPYMLVIGEKEAAAHSVSVRHAKRGDLGVRPLGEFMEALQFELTLRRLETLVPAFGHPARAESPLRWAQTAGADTMTLESLPDTKMSHRKLCAFCADSTETDLACFCAILAWRGHKLENAGYALRHFGLIAPLISDLRSGKLDGLSAFQRFSELKRDGSLDYIRPAYFSALIHFLTGGKGGFILGRAIAEKVNLKFGMTIILNQDGYVCDSNTTHHYGRFSEAIRKHSDDQKLPDWLAMMELLVG